MSTLLLIPKALRGNEHRGSAQCLLPHGQKNEFMMLIYPPRLFSDMKGFLMQIQLNCTQQARRRATAERQNLGGQMTKCMKTFS